MFRELAFRAEGAVDLVGRNLNELVEFLVAGGFEQRQCTGDIGFYEDLRLGDRTIHVAFGREVNNRLDPMLGDDAFDQYAVTDIAFDELVILVLHKFGEVAEIAGVGQSIEIDDQAIRVLGKHHPYKITADKSRPARNQNSFHNCLK